MALPADQVAALQRKASADAAHPEPMSTTDERPAFDFNEETIARPFHPPTPDEDDIVVVDDIAEAVEDEESEEQGKPKVRSSAPPTRD